MHGPEPGIRHGTRTGGGTATAVVAREPVMRALATVRDPELDEPLTTLGFVDGVEVTPTRVEVRLRLPTSFCAPNFAYLMVADARAAVRQVVDPAVQVSVRLLDHIASDDINRGVGCGAGFAGTFGEEAGGELDELRATFRRKAYGMRQERLCRRLLGLGAHESDLAGMTLADLPDGEETRAYLARRAELGLEMAGTAPFLLDAGGRPVPPAAVAGYLRFARTVRVSIEGNAGFCRGLLQTRYGTAAR